MEAEFVTNALETAKGLIEDTRVYRMLRMQEEECIRLNKEIPYITIEPMHKFEEGLGIRELTHSLIRASETGCNVAGWSALIALSREAVDSLCSTFEKYPQRDEVEKELNVLLKTVEELEKRKAASIQHQPKPQHQPPHFNSPQSKEELTKIFQRLKEHGFFDDSADLETWLYICGVGDLNGDFRPLNWIGDRQLLGLAITKLFDNDKRRYWAITMKVFLAGGDVITKEIIDGMKNSVSKLVNDWKNDTSAATLILSIIAGD